MKIELESWIVKHSELTDAMRHWLGLEKTNGTYYIAFTIDHDIILYREYEDTDHAEEA